MIEGPKNWLLWTNPASWSMMGLDVSQVGGIWAEYWGISKILAESMENG